MVPVVVQEKGDKQAKHVEAQSLVAYPGKPLQTLEGVDRKVA